jgi:hypothetical protein
VHLNYINLHVLFRFKHASGVFAEAGLQAGLLVNGKIEHWGLKPDVKDVFRSIDLSLPVGIGFQLPMGLGVNLRYNHGLSNISEYNGPAIRNKVLQAGLLYMMGKR